MYLLPSIRSITFPWSRSSNLGEDPEADSDDDSTSVGGFSNAKILYTTLGLLLLFGTVFGSSFGTSAAVQHSKADNVAMVEIYEQLEDSGEVSSLGVDQVMPVACANYLREYLFVYGGASRSSFKCLLVNILKAFVCKPER